MDIKWNLISHNHRYAHYTPISSRVSFPPLPLQAPPKPSVSSPYIYPRFLCRHPSPQFSSTPLSCLQFSSHPCHPMPSVRLRALDPPVFTPAHIPPPPMLWTPAQLTPHRSPTPSPYSDSWSSSSDSPHPRSQSPPSPVHSSSSVSAWHPSLPLSGSQRSISGRVDLIFGLGCLELCRSRVCVRRSRSCL